MFKKDMFMPFSSLLDIFCINVCIIKNNCELLANGCIGDKYIISINNL